LDGVKEEGGVDGEGEGLADGRHGEFFG
jgi:hypothetical protein